jgi:hypothetical protein
MMADNTGNMTTLLLEAINNDGRREWKHVSSVVRLIQMWKLPVFGNITTNIRDFVEGGRKSSKHSSGC